MTETHNAAYRAAKRAGEKMYTGQPCPRCASTLRYVCSRACVVCQRAASRASIERRRKA